MFFSSHAACNASDVRHNDDSALPASVHFTQLTMRSDTGYGSQAGLPLLLAVPIVIVLCTFLGLVNGLIVVRLSQAVAEPARVAWMVLG